MASHLRKRSTISALTLRLFLSASICNMLPQYMRQNMPTLSINSRWKSIFLWLWEQRARSSRNCIHDICISPEIHAIIRCSAPIFFIWNEIWGRPRSIPEQEHIQQKKDWQLLQKEWNQISVSAITALPLIFMLYVLTVIRALYFLIIQRSLSADLITSSLRTRLLSWCLPVTGRCSKWAVIWSIYSCVFYPAFICVLDCFTFATGSCQANTRSHSRCFCVCQYLWHCYFGSNVNHSIMELQSYFSLQHFL